jgi:hypothetical protein
VVSGDSFWVFYDGAAVVDGGGYGAVYGVNGWLYLGLEATSSGWAAWMSGDGVVWEQVASGSGVFTPTASLVGVIENDPGDGLDFHVQFVSMGVASVFNVAPS